MLILGALILRQTAVSFWNPVKKNNEDGNSAFVKETYDRALNAYQRAERESPDDPVIQYNLGNVWYKKNDFHQAITNYRRALSRADKSLRSRIQHNLGNCYYQLRQYDKSVLAYKRALEVDDRDKQTKHNLELAKKKLREHSSKEKNYEQNQTKEEKSGQQDKNQNSGEQPDQNKDNKSNQEKRNSPSPNKEETPQSMAETGGKEKSQGDKKNQKKAKSGPPLKISQKEAERILQVLMEKQKEQPPLKPKGQTKPGRRNGKKW